MLNGKTIAVVVPCYNEESQISTVIDTMPNFVDRIIIVDDCSKDKTIEVVKGYFGEKNLSPVKLKSFPNLVEENRFNRAEIVVQNKDLEEIKLFPKSTVLNENPEEERIILIKSHVNGGVGVSIARGYKWCKDHEIDCTAVMAGDGQMDPSELEPLCLPVVAGQADYVKGNRLIHRSAPYVIPKIRRFGNSVLSILTKIASGYWRISDTQTGYTTISARALKAIKIHKIYPRYGMPNDVLVKLNIAQMKVKEIEIKPVYNVGEQSKMKIPVVIPKVSLLLVKLFFQRIWRKYLFRDFHPLFVFYYLSFALALGSIPYAIKIVSSFVFSTTMGYEPLFAFVFLFLGALQSFGFAMWMDMQDNDRLYVSD